MKLITEPSLPGYHELMKYRTYAGPHLIFFFVFAIEVFVVRS
jgi:hypothetical protein